MSTAGPVRAASVMAAPFGVARYVFVGVYS